MPVDVEALRRILPGNVIGPGDHGWDEARRPWNLAFDQSPALVVAASSVDDVAATVRWAATNGLRVAPQSTGHGTASLGDLSGAILLRTSALDAVSVDHERGRARAEAGARWRQVIAPAAEHGLACLHGMSGGVGVTGYTLGGGLGWLARREGLAASHVRSFEVVTADGERRTVNAELEPDLFWALRGGGGAPAVVTALEFDLFELREVFAGALLWPIERAGELLHAYREWTASVPDSLTSTFKLMRFPPLPQVPEPLRGRALVMITLAYAGPEAEGAELAEPLRQVAAPYLDTLGTIPAAGLGDLAGDPQDPGPGVGDGVLIDELTTGVADACVELAGPEAKTPLTALEVRHLGGALRSGTKDPGPAAPIESGALVYAVGAPMTPADGVAIRDALDAIAERLAPWFGPRATLPGFDERGRSLGELFTPAVAERLVEVSARYDPDGRLVANHVAG